MLRGKGMKKVILAITLFIFMMLVGCSEMFKADADISISVDNYFIEVEVGDFVSVSPIVTGSTNSLYYDSSNINVFTVSNGVISGISEGEGILTIGVLNTDVSVRVNVTVTAVEDGGSEIDDTPDTPPIDDTPEEHINRVLLISNGDQNLIVGAEVNLLAILGGVLISENVSWMSSNIGVATVSSTGVLSAKAAGTTMILAMYGNLSATINVTVRVAQPVVINPTSLIINGSSFVNVSDSIVLTVSPDKGSIVGGLIWSTNDEEIATVNNFGIVTGVSVGVVQITATLANDPSVSNTFTLLVKEVETSGSPITSINLSGATEVLQGNKIKLNMNYTPANEPATFTYSSSNDAVATVSSAGWVTGISGGNVQITASLVGDPEKKATISITVIPLPEGITISGASTVSYGQNIILTASTYPVGANNVVTWSSSDASVVAIDNNGRVTGMKVGTATITATSIVSASIKATHTVTVTDQMSITLNPNSLNLVAGSSSTITATVVAASLTDKSVAWSSSDASVATVDSNGKVTAVKTGSANIIAKLNANNSIQAQASITVTAPSLPTITISDATASLLVGATKTLTATVGNTGNTSVTWSTSNQAVATVSTTGLVTAKAEGSATITATSVADTSVKATCAVTVTAPPATGGTLTITQTPAGTIEVGATGYELFIKDEEGTAVSRLECTFTSSNSSVATVSNWGTISALSTGTAEITVTHSTKGTGTITLTIGSGSTPPVGTLTITQSPTGTIAVGATGYELYIKDSDGNPVSRLDCTFTPSDSSIATVSSYGTISALKAGSTTITVTHPTKGTGTITVTVGSGGSTGNTATDATGKATYTRNPSASTTITVPGSTATTYIKEYGTVGTKTIRVSILEQKCNSNAKIISWAMPNSGGYGFTRGTISTIAANYETNHPGWRVLGGINADQYTLGFGTGLGVDGKHPYHSQPYYPFIADGQKWFSKTWMASGSGSVGNFVGYTNDGSVDQLISVNAASAATSLKLSILNANGTVASKYTVNKFNNSPASGEVALYTGYYSDTSLGTYLSKSVSGTNVFVVGSADLAYCNNTTAYTKVTHTQNAFYGKGTISSKTTSATLARSQFAIVSNNSTVTTALAVGKKILVQYEYTNSTYNAFESGMGYHTVQRDGGVDKAVVGDYNIYGRPRSVVGRKADGTIVLLIIDDYNDSYGTTGYGINAICKLHGIVEAYQMDGGGSAQMAVRQSNGTFAGVTRSADEKAGENTGSQRYVMSALLFVVKV